MTTKPESGSVVSLGNLLYVENDPVIHESYWTVHESHPEFDSDEKTIAYLHKLKNKQIRRSHPDTYKKCELIICKTFATEERSFLKTKDRLGITGNIKDLKSGISFFERIRKHIEYLENKIK